MKRRNDTEREGRAAMSEYVGSRLVFFVPGAAGDKPLSVSSATASATPAGRPVLLTAGHCAGDATDQPIRLGYYKCTQVLQDVVAGVAKHPDPSVDVAVLTLKPNVRDVLRPFTVTPDVVTSGDDIRPDTDALVVAGFPAALMSDSPNGAPRYGFRSVTYGTALAQQPRDTRGRYRVQWSERETPDGTLEMWNPKGISGGALWRFRQPSKDEVWSLDSAGRLVGIPVAWLPSERIVYAEPASKWRAWLVDTLAAIDRRLPFSP